MATRSPSRDLREACLAEARDIIRQEGLEQLSLRTVARRLGVSHQAPYKHFASRDAILAELVRRAFAAFDAHLEALPASLEPRQVLRQMGTAYVAYALANPEEYRLMFGTPLPDPDQHPEMIAQAQAPFERLCGALRALHGPSISAQVAEQDAMFIWSALHGLSTILASQINSRLQLAPAPPEALVAHILDRIGDSMRP